jgi:hypothetical protein
LVGEEELLHGQTLVSVVGVGGRQRVRGGLQPQPDRVDLDFDGSSYQPDFPDGQRGHPTTFQYLGPFDGRGHTYPTIQYETDIPASEILCNTSTGAGCVAQPVGANFYPFWTLGRGQGAQRHTCLWNFGNVIPGTTILSFGRVAEYGTPDVARFAGTVISREFSNPQFNGSCHA